MLLDYTDEIVSVEFPSVGHPPLDCSLICPPEHNPVRSVTDTDNPSIKITVWGGASAATLN